MFSPWAGMRWAMTGRTNESGKITSQAIVDLIARGHEVIVTHGNGPQVGMINQAFEAAAKLKRIRQCCRCLSVLP